MNEISKLNQQIIPLENNEELLLSLFDVEELEVRLEFIPVNDSCDGSCTSVNVACNTGNLGCNTGNGVCF